MSNLASAFASRLSALALPALLAALPTVPLAAQTAVSLITTGNWSVPANWNPNVVPNNAGANVYNVTVAGGRTATVDNDYTINNLSIVGVGSPGAFSTVNLGPGRTLTVNGSLSAGLYTQFTGGGTITLNAGPGASSGSSGNSALTFNNVTFNNQAGSTFSEGAANGAFSTVLSSGAVINNAGTYSMDGASCSLTGPATTAFNNGGTYQGSGYLTTPFINTGTILSNGSGTSRGQANAAGVLEFGVGGTSSGTVNTGTTVYESVQFDTGTWNFTSTSTNTGAGGFTVAGAAVTINGAHNVSGKTTVSSGSLTFANPNASFGILSVTGGTTTFTGANTLAEFDLGAPGSGGGTAVVNLGANGALTVNGAFNTGTYSQVNGTGTASITANGGGSVGANSAFILSGVALNNAVGSTITEANAGGFDNTLQNGAVINNAGTWVLQNQNGRGIVAASGAAGVGAAFNNTGTLTANVTYTSANLGVALNNSGVVRLDTGVGGGGAPSLAVGTYTQTAGSLQLNHTPGATSATLSSSNPIQIQGGSVVGNGRFVGNVVVTGANTSLSPGYGIGSITVQGTFQQTGGALTLEIGRTGTGAGGAVNDLLTGTSTLSLTGTAVTISLLPGSQYLQVGDAFTILSSTNNGLVLTGDTFTRDASLNLYTFSTTQTAGGYTLTVTGVPEPGTWAVTLLAVGILTWTTLRRRGVWTC